MEVSYLDDLKKNLKDTDDKQRIFSQMVEKGVHVPLKFRHFKEPLTLIRLLNVFFGSDTDSGSSSNSCSEPDSPNSSPEKVCYEEGLLDVDQILYQLPSSCPLSEFDRQLYIQSSRCAFQGLAYYNAKNQGAEYELVAPLLSTSYFSGDADSWYYLHGNFLAKRKSPADSLPELFFVEMKACYIGDSDNPVLRCSIVEPRLGCPSGALESSVQRTIFHPLDIGYCSTCYDEVSNNILDSDSESEE